MFYDISAVLMSGGYFYSAGDAMRHYPAFSTAMELTAKAALYSDVLSSKLIGRAPSTYLLPVNDALSKVAPELGKAPADQLVDLLEYHIIEGLMPVPRGWKSSTVATLLPGHNLTARLYKAESTDPFTGERQQAPSLTLVPEVGRPASVTIMNIYAGQSIIQGINGILAPNTGVVQLLANSNSAGTGRRHRRRRLLQASRSRSTRQSKANTWTAQNTQSAIRAAAVGNIPASYATAAGSRNAQLAAGGCVNCLRWGL
uniref:FAS1 domain-containing protein n=1 Tax=Tetradesmus obliquus TaxID=3088 RepID=A0A383W7G9_TETOB|eukprot:jgi/Sobl393_1/2019/SZX73391.1